MSVSGRKSSSVSYTVSKRTSNDSFSQFPPCLTCDKEMETIGFCVECQERMCTYCISQHRKSRASSKHTILDKAEADEKHVPDTAAEVFTEKCQIHKDEIIKYFCQNHETLCCSDCIVLFHRSCNIEHILDKSSDIGQSDEYLGTMWLLDHKIKEIDLVKRKAISKEKEIDELHENITMELTTVWKNLYHKLEQLQKEMLSTLAKTREDDKTLVKGVLEACTEFYNDVKGIKSAVQKAKTSQRNCELYILLKRAQSKVEENGVEQAETSLETTHTEYTCAFEPEECLNKLLTGLNSIGEMQLCSSQSIIKKEKFDTLTSEGNINVKTKSDSTPCFISGCHIIESMKLALVDFNNMKLKIVDIKNKAVIAELKLSSKPYDVAVLPKERVAITLPNEKEIVIFTTTADQAEPIIMRTKGEPRGISFHQDDLYVVCRNPDDIEIYDEQGYIRNRITLKTNLSFSLNYVAVSGRSRRIFVSTLDSDHHCLASFNLKGEVMALYEHKSVREPEGIVQLLDGSLLVVCLNNNSIFRLSEDFRVGLKLKKGLYDPQCICYDQKVQHIYVGGHSDVLQIFTIK